MAFLVETGSGDPLSNAYISVADATDYFTARGNAVWPTLTTPQQEQAIIRATDFMVQMYRGRWQGVKRVWNQGLDWPRYNVVLTDVGYAEGVFALPDNIVPKEVKNACAELAVRASQGDLLADTERGILEETIGPLKWKYDPASPDRKEYNVVDEMVRIYLEGASTGAMHRLVRT